MIRYVAIGAVVGFLVAFFLLSHGSEPDELLPPVPVAEPAARPSYRNPAELMKLEKLPFNIEPRRLPLDPAPDAG